MGERVDRRKHPVVERVAFGSAIVIVLAVLVWYVTANI